MRSAATNCQGVRLLLAGLLSALLGCGSAAHRTLEETFEQIYTIEPTANVTLINSEGAVFVYGSSTNEMRVQAIKRAFTRERLKQIAVDVSIQPGSVSINTRFPTKPKPALFGSSGTVDYTIVIPATANLTRLELGAGEVVVDGMHGQRMHASLGSGRMFARNCFGKVALTLDRGTLTLVYDWWDPGNFQFKQTSRTEMPGPFSRLRLFVIWSLKRGTEKLEMISRNQHSAEQKRPQRSIC